MFFSELFVNKAAYISAFYPLILQRVSKDKGILLRIPSTVTDFRKHNMDTIFFLIYSPYFDFIHCLNNVLIGVLFPSSTESNTPKIMLCI